MVRRTKLIPTIVLALILISGCTNAPAATLVPGLEKTLAVRTIVATMGVSYIATLTPTPAATQTPQPIFDNLTSNVYQPEISTPIPSLTPFSINMDLSSAGSPCFNNAEFVQDVTYEDQARLTPGEQFTKVWRLRNAGTCVWSPDYSIVFTFGDKLEGESPKPIGIEVKPGETVDVGMDMIAPKIPEIYSGNWMLQDDQGNVFGCGTSNRNYFWVSIVVGGGGLKNVFGGFCGGGG